MIDEPFSAGPSFLHTLSLISQGNWAIPILITAVAFVAVYGTYLMVTYFMARGIVSYRTSKARG